MYFNSIIALLITLLAKNSFSYRMPRTRSSCTSCSVQKSTVRHIVQMRTEFLPFQCSPDPFVGILRRAKIVIQQESRRSIPIFNTRLIEYLIIAIRRIVSLAAPFLLVLKANIPRVFASSTVNGWDLYGRVPYDDWLFSTWKLTDKNLLRRSLTEKLMDEWPIVTGVFNRRKIINDIVLMVKSAGLFLMLFTVLGLAFSGANNYRERIRGEISATLKKSKKKGVIMPGTDGWIDYEIPTTNQDKKSDDNNSDEPEEKVLE